MPVANKTYLPYVVLALAAIPLFFLNIWDVHSWGDDFSQYIKEAQNIAQGKPYYSSNYIFNKYNPAYAPPQYPPGFPLLLAPIVKAWGISFRAFCYYNSCLVTVLLFALYAFFRRHAGTVAAVCLSIALVYCGQLLDLKRQVLADIPCLIFVSLYLAVRARETFKPRDIALLIVFAVAAIQTRSQAIFLVAAEGLFVVYQLVLSYRKNERPDWQSAKPILMVIAGVFAVNAILDHLVFPTPASTTVFYNQFIKNAMGAGKRRTFVEFFGYAIETAKGFYHYDSYQVFVRAFGQVAEDAGLTLSIIGLLLRIRKGIQVEDIFMGIMVGLIIFYPVRDPRYFLPAVPVLYLYCYTALRALVPMVTSIDRRLVAISLTVVYLFCGFTTLVAATHPDTRGAIPAATDQQAFDYIRAHVKDDEIIIFTKPRALTLFTNKKAINLAWQEHLWRNREIFDSMKVKYMLIVDGLDNGYSRSYIDSLPQAPPHVRIADKYTLYTLR